MHSRMIFWENYHKILKVSLCIVCYVEQKLIRLEDLAVTEGVDSLTTSDHTEVCIYKNLSLYVQLEQSWRLESRDGQIQ